MITFFGIKRIEKKFISPSDLEPVLFRATIWEWMPLRSLILEASQKDKLENSWVMVDPNLLTWQVFKAIEASRDCDNLSHSLLELVLETNTQLFTIDCELLEEQRLAMKALQEMIVDEVGAGDVDPASVEFTHPVTFEIERERVLEFIRFLHSVEYFWIC